MTSLYEMISKESKHERPKMSNWKTISISLPSIKSNDDLIELVLNNTCKDDDRATEIINYLRTNTESLTTHKRAVKSEAYWGEQDWHDIRLTNFDVESFSRPTESDWQGLVDNLKSAKTHEDLLKLVLQYTSVDDKEANQFIHSLKEYPNWPLGLRRNKIRDIAKNIKRYNWTDNTKLYSLSLDGSLDENINSIKSIEARYKVKCLDNIDMPWGQATYKFIGQKEGLRKLQHWWFQGEFDDEFDETIKPYKR